MTNCLNFGDPTRPEAFWQLREAVRGLGDACRALGVPVTGGNVSLYNEAPGSSIAPTPEIGVVGLADDATALVGPAFGADGLVVLLAGSGGPGLGGSAYAALAGRGADEDPPWLDLAREAALQAWLRAAVAARLVGAAQDISRGGLAVALAEMALWGERGGRFRVPVAGSPAVALFGESPSRALVAAPAGAVPRLRALATRHDVPLAELGVTGGERLLIELGGEGATGAAEARGAVWRTPSTSTSSTCATPGSTGSRGRSAWRLGRVRRLRGRDPRRRRRPIRRARALRAPAPGQESAGSPPPTGSS